MKRILDTVHGYIMVDEKFICHIIDTPLFQRLRRVEQTSIRAVYPSARHDRFIHSLGVFHIGSLIVSQLKTDAVANKNWNETDATLEKVYGSYLAACLLHDIAHAPFSHSFESYYGQKRILAEELKNAIKKKSFSKDLDKIIKIDEPNFHEYASAFLVVKEYKNTLTQLGYDTELVVRMITGVFYDKEKSVHQIHNCFISLLHGKVIDADRLDYACRDVWASGYCTSKIDLRRLVSALHIKKKDDDYVVCFESNSLNEIDGVLNVKDFQTKFVINHHTVVYEQHLLQQAAEKAAMYFFPAENDKEKDNPGFVALNKIVNVKSLYDEVRTKKGNLSIRLLSDDDLVFLMKQTPDNDYYKEWSSRSYSRFALWKSKDEFHHYFPSVSKNTTLANNNFGQTIKDALKEKGYEENDVQINEIKFKCRVPLKSLYLVVANDVVRYTDIKGEDEERKDIVFYYVFITKKKCKTADEVKHERNEIIEVLKKPLEDLYKEIQ